MPFLDTTLKKVLLDQDGYLVHFEDWDEDVARALAARSGIGDLTRDSLNMLQFIRDYYEKYDFFPIVRSICKNVHKSNDCVQENFINPLFAWKIAGLPQPEEPIIQSPRSRPVAGLSGLIEVQKQAD